MKNALALLAVSSLVLACEPGAGGGTSPASGAIAAVRGRLLIAAEDHDQLLIVDRSSKQIEHRVDVGDGPAHVIALADGSAAVTTRYGGTLDIVDIEQGSLISSIPVGVEPYGLTEVSPGHVAVVLAGEAVLAVVDVASATIEQKIALSDRDPRAVALLPDGSLYVSHMATGAFSRVHLDTGTATRVDVTTADPSGPRLVAEHMRSLTVDPVRGTVLVAHSQANVDTVRAPIDPNTAGASGNCGYDGCSDVVGVAPELPAVTPAITEVDPSSDSVRAPRSNDVGAPAVTSAPSVLNPKEQRFNGTQIANPAAIALFDGGRGQIVVNLGSKNALLLRRDLAGSAADVIGTVPLGNGAQSIAISEDGAFAYVWNQFDMTITEIALPTDVSHEAASKFAQAQQPSDAELSVVPELTANTIELGIEDALSADASFGRKLFHDATDSRIAKDGAVSCASCHPDGRTDGRTWQFVFGPRNTPQLGGSILDTAPFHWPGDVPSVPDLNTMTVLPFMGGTGLDAGTFSHVAAFIDQVRAAPAVAASEAAQRGEQIFYSQSRCSQCHAGAHFTDNVGHDIGTKSVIGRSGSDIDVFQTPVLHGLNRSAPYLHDGSQATLEALVENVVRTDRMGHGSDLSDQDAADLVAFLKTL